MGANKTPIIPIRIDHYKMMYDGNPITPANRKLIAAAPDLLEACKFAFENLRPKGNIKKDFSGHNAMATLSRAIHRATDLESDRKEE